jgi:hypothetical protein
MREKFKVRVLPQQIKNGKIHRFSIDILSFTAFTHLCYKHKVKRKGWATVHGLLCFAATITDRLTGPLIAQNSQQDLFQ